MNRRQESSQNPQKHSLRLQTIRKQPENRFEPFAAVFAEEKEHAAMLIEGIRRRDPTYHKDLKDYLFTEKPIARHRGTSDG